LEKLLQKYPFRDLEIVADSWRRSDPEEYSARVSLQAMLNEKSTAIRMTDTSSDLREYLRDCRMHSPIADLVIDIADGKDTPTNGLIHVQCLIENRPTVTAWIKEIFEQFQEDNPNYQGKPIIAENSSRSESLQRTQLDLQLHRHQTHQNYIQVDHSHHLPSKYASMMGFLGAIKFLLFLVR
jgi:hypothetical protein